MFCSQNAYGAVHSAGMANEGFKALVNGDESFAGGSSGA
jgi:hypothetical protein